MDIEGIHRRPDHPHGSNRRRILPQIDAAERRDRMHRFSGYIAVHDAHLRCAPLLRLRALVKLGKYFVTSVCRTDFSV